MNRNEGEKSHHSGDSSLGRLERLRFWLGRSRFGLDARLPEKGASKPGIKHPRGSSRAVLVLRGPDMDIGDHVFFQGQPMWRNRFES